jgi:hypothetical protein
VRYYRQASQEDTRRVDAQGNTLERVLINIAPYADRIMLDGRIYFANHVYELPERVARTVEDVMAATWRHERSTGGANTNMAGARSYNIGGGHGTTTRLGAPGVPGF